MKLYGIMILLRVMVCAGFAAGAAETAGADGDKLAWWREARFGMFIHWGPSSLTGREISWSRKMPRPGCGHPDWGTLPIELYDNLYLIFNPVDYDAEQLVQIAKDAGMKYLVFTTKHHDGFCNFDAGNTDYKITNPASPFRRDIVRELADACHKHGLRLGFYYSQPDWRHPDYLTENHARFIAYYHEHVRQLLSDYGKVDIIWFDGLGLSKEQFGADTLFPVMYSLQPEILINNRCGLDADFDTPEQKLGTYQRDRAWESCITIGNQWSWHPKEKVKSLKTCIQTLVSCAGGDGNLLFNVGPSPMGVIEPEQVRRLREMGQWLERYGESIYGTRGGPWMPGDFGVTTCRGGRIYVHIFDWLKESVKLPALPAKITKASLLTGGKVRVRQTEDAVRISVSKKDRRDIDTIVVLDIDADAEAMTPMPTLGESIATGCAATASNVHAGNPFYGADKAFDGDPKTRWATDGGTSQAWIEVDLGGERQVSRVFVCEDHGNRTQQFTLRGYADGTWLTLAEGTHLGDRRDLQFDAVTISRLRLEIHKASEGPTISEILVLEPETD